MGEEGTPPVGMIVVHAVRRFSDATYSSETRIFFVFGLVDHDAYSKSFEPYFTVTLDPSTDVSRTSNRTGPPRQSLLQG